jgi:hypothetical protein
MSAVLQMTAPSTHARLQGELDVRERGESPTDLSPERAATGVPSFGPSEHPSSSNLLGGPECKRTLWRSRFRRLLSCQKSKAASA